MAEETEIAWTWRTANDGTVVKGFTFNGWWGCTKASRGCARCYAKTLANRYGWGWGPHAMRKRAGADYWKKPGQWNTAATKLGVRPAVFAFSMADIFDTWTDTRDKAQILADMEAARVKARAYVGPNGQHSSAKAIENRATEWSYLDLTLERAKLWNAVEATPNLDWLLLTKRPEQYLTMTPPEWASGVPSNVWIGTSTEDQAQANIRLVFLLAAQIHMGSPVAWISAEPLLGALDLTRLAYVDPVIVARRLRASYGQAEATAMAERYHEYWKRYISSNTFVSWNATETLLKWVITGGQSAGPDAEALVEQKTPGMPLKGEALGWLRGIRDACNASGVSFYHKQNGGPYSKASGKTFDGREWCEVPSLNGGPRLQERVA